jgi:hypothetical protein
MNFLALLYDMDFPPLARLGPKRVAGAHGILYHARGDAQNEAVLGAHQARPAGMVCRGAG